MRSLDLQAATRALRSRGVVAAEGRERGADGWSHEMGRHTVALRGGDGLTAPRVVPLARWFVNHVRGGRNIGLVVLIDERHIWPSSEDRLLPGLVRAHGGITADVDAQPGTLFASSETAEAASLLACALLCGWGFVRAAGSRRGRSGAALRINHDNQGWASGPELKPVKELAKAWRAGCGLT